MTTLQVKNPFSGKIEKVNFLGDEPSSEEMTSLFSMFQKEAAKYVCTQSAQMY